MHANIAAQEERRRDAERREGVQFRKSKQLVVETNADAEMRLETKIRAVLSSSRVELNNAIEQQSMATASIASDLRKTNNMCYGLAERVAKLERSRLVETPAEPSCPCTHGNQHDQAHSTRASESPCDSVDDEADKGMNLSNQSDDEDEEHPADDTASVSINTRLQSALNDTVNEAADSFKAAIQVHIRRAEQIMARGERRLQLRAREIEAASRLGARLDPEQRLRGNLPRVIAQEQRRVTMRAAAAAQLHEERHRANQAQKQ